jgi:hypothetical protein
VEVVVEEGLLVEIQGRQTLAEGVSGATNSTGEREGGGRVKIREEAAPAEMMGTEAKLQGGGGEEEEEEEEEEEGRSSNREMWGSQEEKVEGTED